MSASGGWTKWDAPDAWDRPHRWQDWAEQLPTLHEAREPEQTGNDEFGFSLQVFGRFPRDVRYYLNVAYEDIGLNKQQTPTAQTMQYGDRGQAGTVPELVFYGLLRDNGFRYLPRGFFAPSTRGFVFQSRLLGGRVPGGAVADFVVFNNHRTIAVRIHSIFHDERNPFGSGGAKTEEDRRQRIKLVSTNYIDNVVDVNRSIDGAPLENGPGMLIREDLRRVMNA
jgi:hypothetical protein